MFKFNFSNERSGHDAATNNMELKREWFDCEQVQPGTEDKLIMKDIFTSCEIYTLDFKENLKYFSTVDVLNVLRTNDECQTTKTLSVINADQDHSDLQTAVYEGGLKIWECTYDLINYLSECELPLKGKKVLDLGCGTGLVGILCLLEGASCTFQDYNREVLQYITIPNVEINGEEYLDHSQFYSGDWQSFINFLTKENNGYKFDYIFTSETIYNTENYSKLHNIFQQTLTKNGEIYLAAKSYYFGIGGGISLFEDYLQSKGIFKYSSSWTCSQGVKREILKITFI